MKIHLFAIIILCVAFSCSGPAGSNPDKARLQNQITQVERTMYTDTLHDIDPSIANNAVMFYNRFVNSYPDDSVSPEYLFRAAQLCQSMKRGELSLEYYQKIEKQYSGFKKMPLVVFMQGYVNETVLHNEKMAREQYERFLVMFPKSPLCKDVVGLISNLGKTDQEILGDIRKKNAVVTVP